MKKSILSLVVALLSLHSLVLAQDTLPKFIVKDAGNNRIVISWTNTFTNIRQISIQRSRDSLNQFKTILTVLDPTLPQNGFVDTKADNARMFYRLYILLDKGVYLFSVTKRPSQDAEVKNVAVLPITEEKTPIIEKVVQPTVVAPVRLPDDTLFVTYPDVTVRNTPDIFTPSQYVYTQRDGYVQISLPADESAANGKSPKKYNIKFFDEGENLLFELKDIKSHSFKLDKTNFYHAGWFRFELYEDGLLLEKHKFFLAKEF